MFSDENGDLYTGSIRLVGAGGSITGQDVDYLIVDDPYEGFTDITPTLLEKKINWFKTIIEQRIEPHSRLIILHTRWHSNDLQGYLKEHETEDYHFITFPAILPDNTPLWPERYTIEELEKKKQTLKPRLFNSIYQQEPLDDTSDFFDVDNIIWGKPTDLDEILETDNLLILDAKYEQNLITEDDYQIEKSKLRKNSILKEVRSWDLASSSKDQGVKRDYTVGIRMYRTRKDQFVISDMVRGQFGNQNKMIIQNTAEADTRNVHITIETGIAAAGKLLYEEWERQLEKFLVDKSEPIGSKADRATPLQNAIIDKTIYVDIDDEKLVKAIVKELKSFPDGKHDDIVDAIAYAYNFLQDESNVATPGFAVLPFKKQN